MTKSPTKTPQRYSEGTGSRTASAANVSADTWVGNAGQPVPPASSVTTSRTPEPLGGSGTEQMRRKAQPPETRTHAPQSATDTARDAAEQVKERASELYEQASERAGELYERATDFAHDVYERGARSLPEMRRYSRPVENFANENPVLIGLVGVVAGLLIGAVWPRSRDRRGHWADDARNY